MSAAESLRLARIEAGLNLRDAARMHQMTPRRLSNLENEREEPTQTLKEQMHRRYGYVAGMKVEGREWTREDVDSLIDSLAHAEQRERFWRPSNPRSG